MSFLSKLFGNKKVDTTYSGQKPYGTLRDAEGGRDVLDAYRARLAGRGVGYSPDFADRAANPLIAKMRSRFKSYELPELKSELSAQGRREGSAGFDQIRRAHQEQGLNEDAAYSPFYVAQEEAARDDRNSALTGLSNYAMNDLRARADRSAFDYADNNRLVQEADTRRQRQAGGYQKLGELGVRLATAPFTGGASMAGFNPSVNSGGVDYPTSQPPAGYDYRNIRPFANTNRPIVRNGQAGRIL